MNFLPMQGTSANGYEPSPFVAPALWNEVEPYLLPSNHPIKPSLDKIFHRSRATGSLRAMRRADFTLDPPRTADRLIAAKHPKLKGYLIKTFTDAQTMVTDEGYLWIQRIKGARLIQESLDRHGFNSLMKVPKKWIYPLPQDPAPEGETYRRNFVLVVEDMKILHSSKNERAYLHDISKDKLKALYAVLTENVLIDSIYIDNIPFCRDGRIAFIDTEHYLTSIKPLRLHRLASRLSPAMQSYWLSLIQ